MKKTISLMLAVCLVLGLTAGAASASSNLSSAQQIVQTLGIINGDEYGNLNLSSGVTRAQFAKMMIAASEYKDTISSTSKSSPFKDVKYTHWAASYIQTAVTAGWLSGYTDGTYRPDNGVTLEEAACAVLKMLDYTSSDDFKGSFPEAQLAKYYALGLNTGISKTQGQTLTREDCVYLFYNLMTAETKSGEYYAKGLGYTVNDSGELDYSSLVVANMSGPFIVDNSSWTSSLPFSSGSATVYKNDAVSTISAVSTYDVYYYNIGMKTVWAYNNRVTGVYTAASPSTSTPSSVTVAGKTYTVAASGAAYALSNMGSYGIGDTVTLLLGMDGKEVVGVVSPTLVYTTKYGVVTSTGSKSYTDSSGNAVSAYMVTVACTDGGTYDYECSNRSVGTGDVVMITYTDGEISVSLANYANVYGTVNSSATALGIYKFADDIQIMDISSNGSYVTVTPSRLAGITLLSSYVRCCVFDGSGAISRLILNDVTGDLYTYGLLVKGSGSSYTFLVDGSTVSGASDGEYDVSSGPVQIELSGGSLLHMKRLTGTVLSSLSSGYATANGTKYTLGNGVSAYVYKDGSYNLSSISAINADADSYVITGYYDKTPDEGGRIRVIVACPTAS